MALRLQIVSRHRQSLGERSIKEFGPDGGTIGRSLESDWVLPDGQRFLSSRHASIDFRSGSYYIVDTSTNGVYVNDSEQPVGRGKPQRLFSGDRVRIGEYEILVSIDELDSTREQLADLPHIDPVDARQRVDAPDPTGRDLVDAFEVTGVGIEMLLEEDQAETLTPLDYRFRGDGLELEESTPRAKKPKVKPKTRARSTAPQMPRQSTTTQPPAPQAAPPQTAATPAPPIAAAQRPAKSRKSVKRVSSAARAAAHGDAAAGGAPTPLDAFFRGAGLEAPALDARQTEQILHRLGQLMREMIVGLSENLHVRATQKNALRQSNTTIQPQDNNPLKFSAGVDEALANLFFRESEQYLDAVDAVREAFGDLKQHQQILLKAMQAAVADYIARLDPDELEEKFSSRRGGVLLGATNKLKYWDLYKDLYQVVAQQNPGELPQLFVEEISRAYEAETARITGVRPGQKLKVG